MDKAELERDVERARYHVARESGSIVLTLMYAILCLEYAKTSVTGLRHPRHPASTAHTCYARCSVLSSRHAIVDICCLRQQQFQLHS